MNKIEPKDLKRLLDLTYSAHQEHNTRDDFRQQGKVPFVEHPMWCALTLLHDQRIPFVERELGYQILLLHDVLEDTNLTLPNDISQNVVDGIKEMTFENWEQEKSQLVNKPVFIKLLKLVDKISTMLEEHVRQDPIKRKEWKEVTQKLLIDVENHYGNIRIVTLAKAVLNDTDW